MISKMRNLSPFHSYRGIGSLHSEAPQQRLSINIEFRDVNQHCPLMESFDKVRERHQSNRVLSYHWWILCSSFRKLCESNLSLRCLGPLPMQILQFCQVHQIIIKYSNQSNQIKSNNWMIQSILEVYLPRSNADLSISSSSPISNNLKVVFTRSYQTDWGTLAKKSYQ